MQSGEILDRSLLKFAVRNQHDRPARRRHGDLVTSHSRFAEVRQRYGQVVPLCVVANHRGSVLCAVIPLDSRPPFGDINRISEKDENRHAARKRVIDAHCSVL